MNRWLKRPRAQSRDPAARRQAVASDPLDSLGQTLHEFARADNDAAVRKAALQRAADLDLAHACMHNDSDSQVRDVASRLYRNLLSGKHDHAPPLDDRLKRLDGLQNRDLLEHLARQASEAALREAALRKIDRPGLTMECLLADPDPALRLRLLDDIEDVRQLQRIIDKTHRRDKQLHRQAAARLRAMQLAAGDPVAIQREAELVCLELERLPGGQASQSTIAELDQRWNVIRGKADPVLSTRYDNAHAQSLAAVTAPSEPLQSPVAVARKLPRMDEPEHPSKRVEASPPEVQKLAAENRFQATLAANSTPSPVDTASTPVKKARKDLLPQLEALEAALGAGNLAESDTLLHKILPNQKDIPKKLGARWQRAQHSVAELKHWQQWSNRRQRRQLCVDARAMRASKQHPEAIANRTRDLRQAWDRLDALERTSGRVPAADAALKRRFNALCHHALEPTRPWFQKRDALRKEHSQQIEALLQVDIPDDEDWKALAARRRQLAEARRELDHVDPRSRKSLARRLGRAIEKLDAPLDAHYQNSHKAHERLIEHAKALMELDAEKRTAAARQLQDQWQAMGPGRRDLDRKQWRAFRGAMDAVFEAREQHKQKEIEQAKESRQQAENLLQSLQTGANAHDDPATLQATLREARQQWRTLDVRDKTLARRFDTLRQEIEQRARDLDAEKRHQSYRDWLAAAEKGENTKDMPASLREAIVHRGDTPADPESIRQLLVRMEVLAGIDSPAEDHAARMQLNLERLQASLGSGRRENPRQQLDSYLAQWIAAYSPADTSTALNERFTAALEGILTRIV